MRLKPLCLAFALGLYSAGTAHAGLQDDMNSFFNDMSYASNTTSAKAWQGQAARYVSGARFMRALATRTFSWFLLACRPLTPGVAGLMCIWGRSLS